MSVSGGAKLTTLPTPSQKGLSYEFHNQKDVKYIIIHVERLISTTINTQIERKLRTINWSVRVNLSFLGMIGVDTLPLYSLATASNQLQNHFYMDLAEELIDNSLTQLGDRQGGRETRQRVLVVEPVGLQHPEVRSRPI